MQTFDFGFWKLHTRLYPVFFQGRFFVVVSSLSLIIYTLNLFIVLFPFLAAIFEILETLFLKNLIEIEKPLEKKILPQISTHTYPYTRANLRMFVWPVSKWPILNYRWRYIHFSEVCVKKTSRLIAQLGYKIISYNIVTYHTVPYHAIPTLYNTILYYTIVKRIPYQTHTIAYHSIDHTNCSIPYHTIYHTIIL